jgi:lysophospholipase L1-like esterase
LFIAAVRIAIAAPLSADDSRIAYEGRCAITVAHAVRMGFPGITARLHCNAKTVRAHIAASSDDVLFNVSINDGAPRIERLKKGGNWVVLYEGPASEQSIALLRRTESWQGTCEILGYDVDGTVLAAAPLPTRKLMFIGDSITCGEGVDVEGTTGPRDPLRTNAAHSFGMLLARELSAQCQLVSYGGRGVIRDWQGIRETNNGPQFYERLLPDDPEPRWDPATFRADAVTICLGTNDFSQGIPDQNEFVNAYVEFIRKIQRDAPNAQVFLLDSPILGDDPHGMPKRSVCGAYLDEIVRKAGSPLVKHLALAHYPGGKDDAHPIASQHRQIADALLPTFKAALGW